jgi:hypothetical protein
MIVGVADARLRLEIAAGRLVEGKAGRGRALANFG